MKKDRDARRSELRTKGQELMDTSDIRSTVSVLAASPWMRIVDAFRHYRYACAIRRPRVPTAARIIGAEHRLAGVYPNPDGTCSYVRGD